jgi:hypothetical protein
MRAFPTLFVLGGCQVTQLIAVVDSDYSSPDPLFAVQIQATDLDGEEIGGEYIGMSTNTLPVSFGIQPKGGLKNENVTMRFQALTSDDTLLVERRVVVGFEANEHHLLQVFLGTSCAGVSCATDQTCISGRCQTTFVDVLTLPTIDPGEEFDYDAGTRPIPPPQSCDECGSDQTCIENGTGLPCASSDCFCAGRCDPFNLVPVCPIGEACFWNMQGVRGAGACVSEEASTEPNHLATCTTGDQCDFFENWACWGPNASSGIIDRGTCTSFCSPPDDFGFCSSRVAPEATCIDLGDGIGACLHQLAPINDLGMSCTDGSQCETGYCSFAGFCSADCSGAAICAPGSDCRYFDNGFTICAQVCADERDCNNPSHACRADQGNICYPSCAEIGCPLNTTCQPDGTCA